jgi:hypothetical protein
LTSAVADTLRLPPSFDVTTDGRLLLLDRVPAPSSAIDVMVNWRDGVGRRTSP